MNNKITILSIICVISVIYAILLYFRSTNQLEAIRVEELAAVEELAELKKTNDTLLNDINHMYDNDVIRALAWEHLGMTDIRETIFYFTNREGN